MNPTVSAVMDKVFAGLDAGLERGAMIDEARALEAQGMTPEQVLEKLNVQRQADHQALGDALK